MRKNTALESSLAVNLSTKFQIRVIWFCMMFFALQASTDGLGYIFGPLERFDPAFSEKYQANLSLVRTHAVFSATALCTGLLAFWQQTWKGHVHALVGRIYGLGVLVGGITGIPMALMAEGGFSSRLAFLLQACLWLITLTLAVSFARRKKFASHRRFMIRNYALTYSAVISRLLLHGLQQMGMGFLDLYPILSWTWVLGLAAGEWWIRFSKSRKTLFGRPGF